MNNNIPILSNFSSSLPTIGRLAPSPTGNLHLGNAWSFLIAWLACRLENGTIFLRMEDIDTQRSKKEYANSIIKDLSWLGIDWDNEIIWQSERSSLYESNIQRLSSRIYKCYCTRKELRDLAGAPQQNRPQDCRQKNISNDKQKEQIRFVMPDTGTPYNGTCRNLSLELQKEKEQKNASFCLRIACPPFTLAETQYTQQDKSFATPSHTQEEFFKHIQFNDLVLGEQNFSLADCGGDFALRRSDNVWAYQLAVSSDDMAMGINQIVRGNDILSSSPRQLYIYSLFGYCPPRFAHIPLLLDENGDRLAKRHASMSLETMRKHNSSPTKIISYLAMLMGIKGTFNHAGHLLQCLKNQKITQFPWANLQKYNDQTGIIIKN